MKFTENIEKVIFRKDWEDKTFYKIGLSKKGLNGDYENGYMDCRFKKDVKLPNMTKIIIKESFLTFYLKNITGNDGKTYKETVPYIFVLDFEIVDEEGNAFLDSMGDIVHHEESSSSDDEIDISDIELPFDNI